MDLVFAVDEDPLRCMGGDLRVPRHLGDMIMIRIIRKMRKEEEEEEEDDDNDEDDGDDGDHGQHPPCHHCPLVYDLNMF